MRSMQAPLLLLCLTSTIPLPRHNLISGRVGPNPWTLSEMVS